MGADLPERPADAEAPRFVIQAFKDPGTAEVPGSDLERLQRMRREHVDRSFAPTAADLRLPAQWLQLRRTTVDPAARAQVDQVAQLLSAGDLAAARSRLRALAGRR